MLLFLSGLALGVFLMLFFVDFVFRKNYHVPDDALSDCCYASVVEKKETYCLNCSNRCKVKKNE